MSREAFKGNEDARISTHEEEQSLRITVLLVDERQDCRLPN